MKTTIHDSGMIINEEPVNGSSNPHECHTFKYQIKYSENFESTETLLSWEWFLTDDVPVGISIDDNGLISGRIEPFIDQPSCQDNYPDEEIKLDGSNWLHNGQFKHPTYTFNFKVHRKYKYLDTLTTLEIEEEVINDISILAIKNNNINNLLFVKKYLETGHELKIDNDPYFKDDINDFLSRHPGPFGCTGYKV